MDTGLGKCPDILIKMSSFVCRKAAAKYHNHQWNNRTSDGWDEKGMVISKWSQPVGNVRFRQRSCSGVKYLFLLPPRRLQSVQTSHQTFIHFSPVNTGSRPVISNDSLFWQLSRHHPPPPSTLWYISWILVVWVCERTSERTCMLIITLGKRKLRTENDVENSIVFVDDDDGEIISLTPVLFMTIRRRWRDKHGSLMTKTWRDENGSKC